MLSVCFYVVQSAVTIGLNSESLASTSVNCCGWLPILERNESITIFEDGMVSSVIVATLI
jgi:hypothetical protein